MHPFPKKLPSFFGITEAVEQIRHMNIRFVALIIKVLLKEPGEILVPGFFEKPFGLCFVSGSIFFLTYYLGNLRATRKRK